MPEHSEKEHGMSKVTPKITIEPGDDLNTGHEADEAAKKAKADGDLSPRAAHVAALETELAFLSHQRVPNPQRIAGVKAELSQYGAKPSERKLETAGGAAKKAAPAKKTVPAKKAAPAAETK